MRILLPVIGVRGDVQIFLALAKALTGQGHRATVAVPERFRALVDAHGVDCRSLGGGPDDGTRQMRAIMEAGSTLAAAKLGIGFFFEGVREHTATLRGLCPDYDLIIGYGSFGLAEADTAGKPFVGVVIDPAMARKRFTGNPLRILGLAVERIAVYSLMGKEYERFRKEIGAPPARESANPRLTLLPMSRHVVQPESNWTDANALTGYWYLETPSTYAPPGDLVDFIERGDPPIFISFGSAGWGEREGSSLLATLAEAVKDAGSRAVVLTSAAEAAGPVSKHIHPVREVPYPWLLDRVSCVVHHCGMGTTAEVLRAGIPSVPVPHMVDQFAWAKRIHRLGVATTPIPRKALTAEKLSRAIRHALEDSALRDKAVELAGRIREEDGVHGAVAAVGRVTGEQGNSR